MTRLKLGWALTVGFALLALVCHVAALALVPSSLDRFDSGSLVSQPKAASVFSTVSTVAWVFSVVSYAISFSIWLHRAPDEVVFERPDFSTRPERGAMPGGPQGDSEGL